LYRNVTLVGGTPYTLKTLAGYIAKTLAGGFLI
jgi:hypothetical protein